MQLTEITELLDQQAGTIARRQILQAGGRPCDIERWLRRNEIRRILPGVYLTHTGLPTWWQRAWSAVLWAEPAALALSSAVRAAVGNRAVGNAAVGNAAADNPGAGKPTKASGIGARDPIHLVVARGRSLHPPDGVVLHWSQSVDSGVLWAASPPRQREEEAALDAAVAQLSGSSARRHLQAVAVLAEPIQARRSTADRMQAALRRRRRIPQRDWLSGVIRDVGEGATTVLEQGYLRLVESPHGLPRAGRQIRERTAFGAPVRDAEYLGRQVVELDGRAFHAGAGRRDADLERDLDAALTGRDTIRLGWGQVFDRPCTTAGKVAALLRQLGWDGQPRPCGSDCPVGEVFRLAVGEPVVAGPPQRCDPDVPGTLRTHH